MRRFVSWIRCAAMHFGRPQRRLCYLSISALSLVGGCQTATRSQAGALLGGGLGAATGAIIGHQSGHTAGGALIGAAAGGLTGGLIGDAQDAREQRDAAVMQARHLEAERQALTNNDVLQMVERGLSDEVIVGTVQHHVGRYDLSPEGTIRLKACGASDRVILAMQQAPQLQPVTAASAMSQSTSPSVIGVLTPHPVFLFGPPRPRFHAPRYPHPFPHHGPRRGRW